MTTTLRYFPAQPLATPAPGVPTRRDASVDLLRGLVMVIMVLDHVRAYLTNVRYDPLDLTQASDALFLTRWITHFCAPIFVLLAGMGARLAGRTRTPGELSLFLLTRGLWLVFLEATVVSFGWYFNLEMSHGIILQVIWAIGASMVVMAALTWLPVSAILAVAVVLIAGHNLLDGVLPAAGVSGDMWRLLHAPGRLTTVPFLAMYPMLPWLGVMALGYVLGGTFRQPERVRNTAFVRIGTSMIVLFVLLRALAVYGDPSPWADGPRAALGFLKVTKYPPSLLYVLMTVGPGLVALGCIDRLRGGPRNLLLTFGRVPFFFYIAHIYLVHALAVGMALLSGFRASQLAVAFPDLPVGYGVSLPLVYVAWVAVLALLYRPCAWFGRLKAKGKEWWWSYI